MLLADRNVLPLLFVGCLLAASCSEGSKDEQGVAISFTTITEWCHLAGEPLPALSSVPGEGPTVADFEAYADRYSALSAAEVDGLPPDALETTGELADHFSNMADQVREGAAPNDVLQSEYSNGRLFEIGQRLDELLATICGELQ